jgi:PTS system nitrogen regulatory IIA component
MNPASPLKSPSLQRGKRGVSSAPSLFCHPSGGREKEADLTSSRSNVGMFRAYARREPSWKSAPYMNLISRLLPASNILLDLPASSKKRVFEQAGLLFENNQGVARAKVFDSLFARERLGSTGLGQGVAIPHGRIKGLKEAVAAFVRVADPIPFDAPDGQPVAVMIFLLVPEQASQAHLDLLSELAQMLSDKSFRQSLLQAPTTEDVHAALTAWEPIRPAA